MAIQTVLCSTDFSTTIRYEPAMALLERDILHTIAIKVADQWIAEHYQDIVSRISQDAVATLTVAEAAAKVRETLEKKIPDKILEIEHTRTQREIYQRGIFGGLTRID